MRLIEYSHSQETTSLLWTMSDNTSTPWHNALSAAVDWRPKICLTLCRLMLEYSPPLILFYLKMSMQPQMTRT
jgi:hypothetical protein